MTSSARRCSKAEASSSMAKATPASGVLKAAATPAAPPAMITPELTGTRRALWTATMIAALIWTVGPSRPTEPPASSMPSVPRNLAPAVRSERSGAISLCEGLGGSHDLGNARSARGGAIEPRGPGDGDEQGRGEHERGIGPGSGQAAEEILCGLARAGEHDGGQPQRERSPMRPVVA
jgi:hypothetical protein